PTGERRGARLADLQELQQAGVPPGPGPDGVERRPGALVLGTGPGLDLGIVTVLEPAFGVVDLDPVDELGGQPRPALGLVPWLAFEVRAFIFFLLVRFDMRCRGYGTGVPSAK